VGKSEVHTAPLDEVVKSFLFLHLIVEVPASSGSGARQNKDQK
jgi:hypothetical protein